MNVRKMYDKFKKTYFEVFTDEFTTDSIVSICTEIRNKIWPADTVLLAQGIVVGQVYEIAGFWRSKWFVRELALALAGRNMRHLCIQHFGWNPESKKVLELTVMIDGDTDAQIARCLPKIGVILHHAWGQDDPPLDVARMQELKDTTRYFMEAAFGQKLKEVPGYWDDDWRLE